MSLHRFAVTLAALSLAALASHAGAQAWPAKPIRMVSAFPPGGTTDILARVLGQKLTEVLGQPVVVENKVGAGGMIGTEAVAKSAPDGYTFLVGNSGALASGLSLYPNIGYDPAKDFASVAIIGDVTIVLAANPQVPVRSIREMIDLAKAKPGELSIAIASVGGIHHLLIEQMKKETGMNLINVPFKGSAPAVTALIGGVVQFDLDNLPAILQNIKAGQARPIAVGDTARSPVLPDVPTFAEAGLPTLSASPWFALVAPGRHAARDHRAHEPRGGRDPEDARRCATSSPRRASTRAGARRPNADQLIRSEITRWARVVKESGAKLE